MTSSQNVVPLIEHAEGFSATIYQDAGHPCIGFGCDLLPNEVEHYQTLQPISRTDAETLLRARLVPTEQAINQLVIVQLNQNQFDALVDFVYNLGTGAFRGSTLLYKINQGDFTGAAQEFARWNHVDGLVNAGLTARREEEKNLFLS